MVLSIGVHLGASTRTIDRATGAIHIDKVPPYTGVVLGTLPGKSIVDALPLCWIASRIYLGAGRIMRLGLVVPSANTTQGIEYWRILPPGVGLRVTSFPFVMYRPPS